MCTGKYFYNKILFCHFTSSIFIFYKDDIIDGSHDQQSCLVVQLVGHHTIEHCTPSLWVRDHMSSG